MYTAKMAEENREILERAIELFRENGFDISLPSIDPETAKHNQYTLDHCAKVNEQLVEDFLDVPVHRISPKIYRAMRKLRSVKK